MATTNEAPGRAADRDTDLRTWLDLPTEHRSSAGLLETVDPKTHILDYWGANTRPDGRMLVQARPTQVSTDGLLQHAAGSALVKQGETKVLAAMTIQVGQPAPDHPDQGDVVVSVTTPTEVHQHSDVLQSWLQRMLDDCLPSSLNLVTGKYCLRLLVTVLILQDSGNLKDAALLACMMAWKNTRLPTMTDELQEVQGKLWLKDDSTMIRKQLSPQIKSMFRVSLSMGIFRNEKGELKLLVDPSDAEMPFVDGKLTIVLTLPERLLQMEYSGSVSLGASELALAAKIANGRADELSRLLQ